MTDKKPLSTQATDVDVPLKPDAPIETFQFAHGFFKPLLFVCGLVNFSAIELFGGADPRLAVKMSWGFSSSIPLRSIQEVERLPDYATYSAGVHTNLNGSWVVNGSLNNLVVLKVNPSVPARSAFIPGKVSRLTLSVVDPDRFVASLRRAMAEAA